MNVNPSLSPPLTCDDCNKEHYDFNNDGSKNFTEIYSDGNYDYCLTCLPKDKQSFNKITVYERIGKALLKTGNIENILKNFTFDFNSNQNPKSKHIPEFLSDDSELYKLALRFYKDMYDLSEPEFKHFKQLLIDSKLIYFNNNTTKTFKVGPDKILKDDLISLNIINAICICPERGEGTSNFLLSISRDGTVGAFESYGLYEKKIIPDMIMDSLECIDTFNLEPDNLLD